MGREFELKYRADPQQLEAIRRFYGPFDTIRMETAYYDTPDRAFSRRLWTLRRRMENGKAVCTLKTPLPDGSRGEWEAVCSSIEGALPLLCAQGAPEDLYALAAAGLTLSCAARFTRLAKTLALGDCLLELALDQGIFLGGGKEQPFAEAEVELRSGPESGALAFAEALAARFGLVPELKSKVQRALALADNI